MLHFRCGSLFAICIEVDFRYGNTPFFSYKKHKGETIILLPFTEIIFTPRRVLLRCRSDDDDETGNREFYRTLK